MDINLSSKFSPYMPSNVSNIINSRTFYFNRQPTPQTPFLYKQPPSLYNKINNIPIENNIIPIEKIPIEKNIKKTVRFSPKINIMYIQNRDYYLQNNTKFMVWWSIMELNAFRALYQQEIAQLQYKYPNKTPRECIYILLDQI